MLTEKNEWGGQQRQGKRGGCELKMSKKSSPIRGNHPLAPINMKGSRISTGSIIFSIRGCGLQGLEVV
jgi:hypothetical protein